MTIPTEVAATATAWATIDLAALRHNCQIARRCAPGAKLWAVVKANGYGHGALEVATALQDLADGFAVARVSEGLLLRAAGITLPLVVLAGASDSDELADACRHQLQLVVHQPGQLAAIAASGLRPGCWLKVDSGMHRLGFAPAEVAAAHRRLRELTGQSVGLISHFASADEPELAATAAQLAAFDGATVGLEGARSLANSAAIVAHPASHRDWIRPGIMLYGGAPLVTGAAADHGLQPVMTLRSRVIAVRELAAGEAVGYGASWRSPVATRIAVVAMGYGDGYPRHAPSGTPVLINGQRLPLVGRVSMDLITVDVGATPVEVGDPVVLWGQGLPASEIATLVGTIDYDLMCALTPRVPRVYLPG